jgi:hypothetical protein
MPKSVLAKLHIVRSRNSDLFPGKIFCFLLRLYRVWGSIGDKATGTVPAFQQISSFLAENFTFTFTFTFTFASLHHFTRHIFV